MTSQTPQYDPKLLDEISNRYKLALDASYSVIDSPMGVCLFRRKKVVSGRDLCGMLFDWEQNPDLRAEKSKVSGGKITLEFKVVPDWEEEQTDCWIKTMANYGFSKTVPNVLRKIEITQLPPRQESKPISRYIY